MKSALRRFHADLCRQGCFRGYIPAALHHDRIFLKQDIHRQNFTVHGHHIQCFFQVTGLQCRCILRRDGLKDLVRIQKSDALEGFKGYHHAFFHEYYAVLYRTHAVFVLVCGHCRKLQKLFHGQEKLLFFPGIYVPFRQHHAGAIACRHLNPVFMCAQADTVQSQV